MASKKLDLIKNFNWPYPNPTDSLSKYDQKIAPCDCSPPPPE